MAELIKILFLSTEPQDDGYRHPGREVREINNRLLLSSERERLRLETEWAVRVDGLQRILLTHKPHVVHFSGRGGTGAGLALADSTEQQQEVNPEALAKLFKLLKDNICLIVINAGYDEQQMRELTQTVDHTVWLSSAMSDDDAITFSTYFYQALAFDRPVPAAFDLAINQFELEGRSSFVAPKRWNRPGANLTRSLVAPTGEQTPNAPSGELSQLRRASRIVEADAKLVIHDAALGGAVCLDQNLYVTRGAEEKIAKQLEAAGSEGEVILLVGEAGRGKTSLLWNLYHTLRKEEGQEVWFIKSTLLSNTTPSRLKTAETSSGDLSAETFSHGIAQARALGKSPVLLLDTLDLLLHDEASRNLLLTLLFSLLEQKCVVVATCRPQEVPRLNPIDFRRVTLVDYEGKELEEAIRKHVVRFYARAVQRDGKDYVAEILDAVMRGLPISEVCTNPLTLRMLFTIYFPSDISTDVNVFELYKQYWRNRVEKDYRAGMPFKDENAQSLENAAMAVALCMLMRGTPEVETGQLRHVASGFGVSEREVEGLVSRGILHASETGKLSFFHQTFFEHSAARGLLKRLGAEALSLLEQRGASKPNDLFTSPIYEQALLLAEDGAASLRARADRAVVNLFESTNLSAVMSGLYVYCHAKDVSHAVEAAAGATLTGADEVVRGRFLELIPNTPKDRLDRLMRELDDVWATGTPRTREHVVRQLKRLVPRDHARVAAFVKRHTLIDYAFEVSSRNVAHLLLEILEGIAVDDPAWGWEHLLKYCRESTDKTKGRELQVALIKFLARNAHLFEPRTIATRFEADTASITLDGARDFEELSDACGELWVAEWRANKSPSPEVLSTISALPEGMPVVTRMKGLGLFLRSVDEHEAAHAFTRFLHEERLYYRARWSNTLLPLWLQGLDCAESRESASIVFLREAVRRVLREAETGAAEHQATRKLLVQALRKAELSPESFLSVLGADMYASSAPWLDEGELAYLLADAYVAGHPGATEAMRLLRARPHNYWRKISRAVGPRMVRKLGTDPRVVDDFFEITLQVEDAQLIQRALEHLDGSAPEVLHRWSERLSRFCRHLMHAKAHPGKRRYAIMIWEHLLKVGFKPVHKFEELTALLNKVGDRAVRGYLISILGRSAAEMRYDLPSIIETLRPYAAGEDVELRRRGMYSLAQAVAESGADVSQYAESILDIALDPPINAERLTILRNLILRLIPGDTELAATLMKKMLRGAVSGRMGTSGMHTLFGRLKPTMRLVARFSSQETRRELVEMVPQLGRVLGSFVTDAVCHEVLIELQPELDALLESKIHSDIKEIILNYRYTQERSLGGEEWSELEQALLR
jgi:energy-coupling factor transporter ATP-binding protein EcfA2